MQRAPISGQVTGRAEARNVLRAALSQHYGGGEWTYRFERGLASFLGRRDAIMCNSGSSANLLALAALELPKGSRILTTAVNFPTTVNAIIQLGHIPVFIDSDPKTLNVRGFPLMEMRNIKAAIIAHTLGNPADLWDMPHRLPVIEDTCDALGSIHNGQKVGRRGIISTLSFYPAHHITTGEGGMVLTDTPKLTKVIKSYRDWGRDCWCDPGCDNTCGKRFDYEWDHKYMYSRIGYNLKASDLQAAVGVAQLDRLEGFIQKRRENWQYLRERLDGLPIEIVEPAPYSEPSWFGFAFLTDKRNQLARYLDERGVGNRPCMGGNLLRQPAYKDVEHEIIGRLDGANEIHERAIWVGCFPGLTKEMLDHTIATMKGFFR